MRPLFLAFALVFLACAPVRAAETAAPAESPAAVSDDTMKKLEFMHAKADKLMEEKKPREAVDVYTEILLLEPDDDAAYTNMGQAYLLLGDAARAHDAFLNALHIDPDNEVAMAGLQSIADPDGTLSGGTLRD